ncbi:MAG: hypothetical protein OXN25_23805 [Candidatus Poribacteria bacterium]|nr:hypothetical protein [Candidatus Poribacteria bacterium]
MNLLEDIQNAAADSSSDVGTLLRKCKILAARLNSQQLEDWITWESSGYPEEVPVPKYRVWQLQVRGNFLGSHSSLSHARVPAMKLPKSVQKSYNEYECRFSIASVESAIENENRVVLTTGGLASTLGKSVYPSMTCVECWAEFSVGDCIELLNAVRNRVLDFTLALWKENPKAGETSSDAQEGLSSDKVTQIFNTTVYSGTGNLVGTANNSSVEFNNIQGDFEAVRQELKNNGVSEEEIAELKAVLVEDRPPQSSNQFGPKVSSWIGKMIEKAASGTWNVSVGAAGNLLAEIISKYYGA